MPEEKAIAKKLVKKFKTNDPYKISKEIGIIIIFECLGSTLGYFNKYKRFRIIHINQDIPEREQRFVCAHELGHVMLHPYVNTPFLKRHTLFSMEKTEREANTFAVELLIPDSMLNRDCSIYDIARCAGIPSKLVELKYLREYLR